MEYLGHKSEYWLELNKRAEELGVVDWIEEVAYLRGRVSFYESRIEQMRKVMERGK